MSGRLRKILLISFDVTGTLLHLRHSPGTIYERVARERFGYQELDVKTLDQGFRRNFKVLSKSNPNYGREQGMNWHTWWSTLVQRTFQEAGVNDQEHLEKMSTELIDLYGTSECWEPADKAVAFVKEIQERGIHTCIITNSDPRTGTILRNVGFPEFDYVLSAFETGFVKPDPRAFQLALTRFRNKSIRPESAMHVGNDLKLDYEAANSCNWTGVLVNKDIPVEDDRKFQFKSIASLKNHLLR